MSKLSFEALRAANKSRAPRWHTSAEGIMEWTIGDWFMGMAGETGEAAEELLPLMFMSFVGKLGALGNISKKYRRVQEGIANKSGDPDRLVNDRETFIKKAFEEIADVQIYLDLFALRLREALNTDEDIGNHVERKFNKTSEMYGFPERLINGEFMLMIDGKLYQPARQYSNLPPVFPGVKITGDVQKAKAGIAEHNRLADLHNDKVAAQQLESGAQVSRMLTQAAEFDAVSAVAECYRLLTKVPPVDDDYPMYRSRYEGAMQELLLRLKSNGRTLPSGVR